MNTLPDFVAPTVLTASALAMASVAAVCYVAARRSGLSLAAAVNATAAVTALLVAWHAAATALAGAGLYRADPVDTVPTIAAALAVPLLVGWLVLRIPALQRVLTRSGVPALLVAAQSFRIFGVVFLILAAQNHLPAQFAVPAGVGDMLVGLAAPVVGWILWRQPHRRRLGITFNSLGLLDLFVAVGMGVTSAPGVLRVFTAPPSTQPLTELPLVLVPAFAVPLAILLHIASLRTLTEAGKPVPVATIPAPVG
jgi:hypothetical protein